MNTHRTFSALTDRGRARYREVRFIFHFALSIDHGFCTDERIESRPIQPTYHLDLLHPSMANTGIHRREVSTTTLDPSRSPVRIENFSREVLLGWNRTG